jgi:hypothetical protein
MPCKAVPKAKQDGSVITIAANAAPTTSTRQGRLLGTAAVPGRLLGTAAVPPNLQPFLRGV